RGSLHLAGAEQRTAGHTGMSLLPAGAGADSDHLGEESKSVRAQAVRRAENSMKRNYDFSNAVKNPYARRLKKQLTIRLVTETVDYFQALSRELSLPYQTLMNMYLRDCATTRRRPEWATPTRKGTRPHRALQ